MTTACKNCKWYRATFLHNGECWVSPPVIYPYICTNAAGNVETIKNTCRPEVYATDGCAKFEEDDKDEAPL